MTSEISPTCSPARVAANRLNALKSSGPKTIEGKERSRQNATKHGFCAAKIDVPGEDPAVLLDREEGWQAELNPSDREVQGYLVHLAVRQTGRLDRLHEAHQARAARLVRDREKVLKEARMREVEELSTLIFERCDIAVRRLRLTPEGCQFLINEWDGLRPALDPPPHWDKADHSHVNRLMGRLSPFLKKSPSPVALATIAITEHREVATKLKKNENVDALMWVEKYVNEQAHQIDLDKVDWLAEKSERYRLWLTQLIDDQIAELRALKTTLEANDALLLAEYAHEARFDASDEGKLIHRYEAETQRSLYRGLKEIQTLNKIDASQSQVVCEKEVAADPSPAPRPASPARNEPIAVRRDDPFASVREVPRGDYAFVNANITPESSQKRQR
jgi:hypothetical protein